MPTTRLAIVVFAVALAGCVKGATARGMTVSSTEVTSAPLGAANAFVVGDVQGGRSTSAFSSPEIANGDFKAALELSLKQVGLLGDASDAPRFRMRATLLRTFGEPQFSMDATVQVEVRYEVTDLRSGDRVFEEVIASRHTTDVTEGVLGQERLRMATEGAARDNIAAFIAKARVLAQ